jgi:hypothetical protein
LDKREEPYADYAVIYQVLGFLLSKDILNELHYLNFKELYKKILFHLRDGIVYHTRIIEPQGPHTKDEAKEIIITEIEYTIRSFRSNTKFNIEPQIDVMSDKLSGTELNRNVLALKRMDEIDRIDNFQLLKFAGLSKMEEFIAVQFMSSISAANTIYPKVLHVKKLTFIEHDMQDIVVCVNEMLEISNKYSIRVAALVGLSYGSHCITLGVSPQQDSDGRRMFLIDSCSRPSEGVLDFWKELILIYKNVGYMPTDFQRVSGPCCVYAAFAMIPFVSNEAQNEPSDGSILMLYRHILKQMILDLRALKQHEQCVDSDIPIMQKWFNNAF